MAIDEDKLSLIERIQEETLKQRGRLLKTFIPENTNAVPFPAQIAFFKDKSLTKLARCGNRAAKTFSTMRDLAWKICRVHPYRQEYNIFNIHDKRLNEKIDSPELEIRYLRSKPEVHWILGPTYGFVNDVMWGKYLEKMIPNWYISEIKYTNQKNIDAVIFKNGDVLKCKTYAQQETTKMGFVVNNVYIDEMPSDVKDITELIVRTFDCDGSVTLGFTPLVENEEVREYLDTACAAGTMALHSWTIYDNPHYRDNPERLKRVLDEYKNMTEQERNSRMGGAWFLNQPDKAVFEGMEPEIVEDFEIPPHWRQVRYTDPASHVTGHAVFAEDPDTATWYVVKGVEITWGHIIKASDIIGEIERHKPNPSFRYLESVYDNAEAWFGAEAKGLGYRPCIVKNREAAIMMTRNAIGDRKLKFFRIGGALALKQFREYHYGKTGKGVVKVKDHVLDCIMYFCREIPAPLPNALTQKTIIQEAIDVCINKAYSPKKKTPADMYISRLFQSNTVRRQSFQRGIR